MRFIMFHVKHLSKYDNPRLHDRTKNHAIAGKSINRINRINVNSGHEIGHEAKKEKRTRVIYLFRRTVS